MLNCIIIDDEPLARKGLKEYIAEADFLQLLGEYDNPVTAMDILGDGRVDLIFLDIQMPGMTGLELLQSLPQLPLVIITTAYPQFAVQGFEWNAVDYLVKPFSFERFWKAVLKARNRRIPGNNMPGEAAPDYFYVKCDTKLVKIEYDSVLYVEALQNYVAIHTEKQKYLAYLTFQRVEAYLPESAFVRTHKSFIVAIQKVESIEGNELRIGNRLIPISRSEKDTVLERLLRNKFLKR